MSDHYHHVVCFSEGTYRPFVFVLVEGQPRVPGQLWRLADPGSEIAKAAYEADRHSSQNALDFSNRLDAVLAENRDFLDGRFAAPTTVEVPPPDELAREILGRASRGRIPLSVAFDLLEDMKKQGVF